MPVRRPTRSSLCRATWLVNEICAAAGDRRLVEQARAGAMARGAIDAVERHDDGPIYDWLMEMFSYQGVSDQIASGYLAAHGNASFAGLQRALKAASCPKLASLWRFDACGYRKASWACGEPDHRFDCPLPSLPLRNGMLNQTAFSLFLFMRDACGGDFVSWLDRRLRSVDLSNDDRVVQLGAAVVEPMTAVFGVSHKVLTMALSALLLAADEGRPLWRSAGAGMIVVDRLVHNWLHRTGLLDGFDATHSYGPGCYAEAGCEALLRRFSRGIDARAFNADYPADFARFVQHAIWRFCAQGELNQCNGVVLDDRRRCNSHSCRLRSQCGRRVLRTAGPK